MLCPNCRERLNPDTLTCPRGHGYGESEGVLVLLDDDFGPRLRQFLAGFSQVRQQDGKRLVDPAAYEALPYGSAVQGAFEWRLRQADLAVVLRQVAGRGPQRVLDVGAWNGWLSHQLARRGHNVTAVDYFVDQFDGLGARQFYSSRWRAIQMDLTDLAVLDETFDIVILNRCVQFFADPVAYVAQARQRVALGGRLIVTGLPVFRDPRHKVVGVQALRQSLQEHGLDFFKPMKGYLDEGDEAGLRRLGLTLHPYPQLRLANLRARFDRQRPRHLYGVWEAA